MAEGQRMTAAEAVDKLMASEHVDVLRESGGAGGRRADGGRGRRSRSAPSSASARRSGARRSATGTASAAWDTRVGELELAIPKLRSGLAYFPSFLEPRKRSEQALVAVVQEAYVNGVSTRKVDRVGRADRACTMSKDQVSRLCRRPRRAHAKRSASDRWRARYPYLWLDGKQSRRSANGGVRASRRALVIAYGVHETGRREVIGLDVGEIESEAFWREFLRSLRRRGLDGVRLCISDAHEGLKNAIAPGTRCPWQRCTVHFVRDMHQHCRPSQRALVSAALREIFDADSDEQARERRQRG